MINCITYLYQVILVLRHRCGWQLESHRQAEEVHDVMEGRAQLWEAKAETLEEEAFKDLVEHY